MRTARNTWELSVKSMSFTFKLAPVTSKNGVKGASLRFLLGARKQSVDGGVCEYQDGARSFKMA
jgi:hypothetical protein